MVNGLREPQALYRVYSLFGGGTESHGGPDEDMIKPSVAVYVERQDVGVLVPARQRLAVSVLSRQFGAVNSPTPGRFRNNGLVKCLGDGQREVHGRQALSGGLIFIAAHFVGVPDQLKQDRSRSRFAITSARPVAGLI